MTTKHGALALMAALGGGLLATPAPVEGSTYARPTITSMTFREFVPGNLLRGPIFPTIVQLEDGMDLDQAQSACRADPNRSAVGDGACNGLLLGQPNSDRARTKYMPGGKDGPTHRSAPPIP